MNLPGPDLHFLGVLGRLEGDDYWTFAGWHLFRVNLLLDLGQLCSSNQGLNDSRVGIIALVGVLGVARDRDHSVGARHLELEVDIPGPRHELGIGRAPQDDVIGTPA